MTSGYSRRVQYYETDQMGIAHHSNYIRWMEEARIDFMRRLGLSCAELELQGVIIPVTKVDCRYISSLRFDETFTVEVRIDTYTGVRFICAYNIYREGEKRPAATGSSEHCFLDGASRRPINFDKKFPQLSAIFRAHQTRSEDGVSK